MTVLVTALITTTFICDLLVKRTNVTRFLVGWLRWAAKWNMVGLMFLFVAAYFACGIGGPPGSLLSHDQLTHDLEAAYDSALLAIFFSVPGWACVLVGTLKMLRGIRSRENTGLE